MSHHNETSTGTLLISGSEWPREPGDAVGEDHPKLPTLMGVQ